MTDVDDVLRKVLGCLKAKLEKEVVEELEKEGVKAVIVYPVSGSLDLPEEKGDRLSMDFYFEKVYDVENTDSKMEEVHQKRGIVPGLYSIKDNGLWRLVDYFDARELDSQ